MFLNNAEKFYYSDTFLLYSKTSNRKYLKFNSSYQFISMYDEKNMEVGNVYNFITQY